MPTRAKPLPRDQRAINRAQQLRRDKDEVKNISVDLEDMDTAIIYYFNNVIRPEVEDNGEIVKVPTMYANQERWKSAQVDGYLKDKKNQVILPLIAFRRTSIEKDDTIPLDKLDANKPNIHYTFQKRYTNINRYDNFTLLGQIGAQPITEFFNVAMPDRVNLSYDFIIWTSYIAQMNKIVEKIVFSEGSYWGREDHMKFRCIIDSYTDATEFGDAERMVKMEFSVTLKGYLLPESYNNEITTKRYLTPRRIVIQQETDIILEPKKTDQQLISLSAAKDIKTQTQVSTTLAYPLTITQGTGVTITNSGIEFNGSAAVSQQISIGQPVELTSDVQFNTVSASSYYIGDSSKNIIINGSGINGNWNITGSLTVTNKMTVQNDVTVLGNLTARQFFTEFVSASIIYASGSTKFGDTIDDNHYRTGSLLISGSFDINGNIVNDISDDTALTDSSTTTLVTENAVKTYVDDQTNDVQTYLRKQFVKVAASITIPNSASFSATTASAPSGVTATSEDDFVFFLNGQYIEHDAITIQQLGSNLLLLIDTGSIGYSLETSDEIIGYGKWNS